MKIIYIDYYDEQFCQDRPNAMVIFGDNECRFGKKGQAIIRDCDNAFGIPTKKFPSMNNSAFYNDKEYASNIASIESALEIIKTHANSGKYNTIYYPINGIGTGLAALEKSAPKTFAKMNELIRVLFIELEKK